MMDQPAEGREGKESLHRRSGNTVLNYGRANKAHLNLSWQETKKTRRDERWMEGWRDGGRVGASRCATTREGERRKKMKETHSRAKEGNTHTHTLLHTLSPQHTHTHIERCRLAPCFHSQKCKWGTAEPDRTSQLPVSGQREAARVSEISLDVKYLTSDM